MNRSFKEGRATLILALPIIVGQLGQISMTLVDTVMVGQLGRVPLAACALGSAIFNIVLVFGLGFSSGLSAWIGRAYGARDRRKVASILRHGLILMIGLALGLSILLEVFTFFFIDRLGQEADVVTETIPYLRWIIWSMLPALMFQALRQYCEAQSATVAPMLLMGMGVLANAFLNYVFIYGAWGFPEWGLEGAGFATHLSRWILLIGIAVYVIRSKRFSDFLPRRWKEPWDSESIKALLHQGIPSGFQAFFEVGAFAGAAVIVGWFGAAELASHQIALNLASITFMVTLGLSFATNIRVSQAAGRGHWRRARLIGFSGIAMGALFMMLCSVALLIWRHDLPSLYISDRDVETLAAVLIGYAALFQIVDGIQGVALGALRGLLDVRFPTAITFVAYWAIALPVGYIFGVTLEWRSAGVWLGLSVGLLAAAISLTHRFNRVSLNHGA